MRPVVQLDGIASFYFQVDILIVTADGKSNKLSCTCVAMYVHVMLW